MNKIIFHNSKKILGILTLLVMTTTLIICSPWLFIRYEINSKTTEVQTEIDAFLMAVNAFTIHYHGRDHEVIKNLFPSNTLGAIPTSVLLSNLSGKNSFISTNFNRINFKTIDEKRIRNDEYIDLWGNPYNFIFDSREQIIPNNHEHPISTPIRLLMWSNGPNGINEWGKGDDICEEVKSQY